MKKKVGLVVVGGSCFLGSSFILLALLFRHRGTKRCSPSRQDQQDEDLGMTGCRDFRRHMAGMVSQERLSCLVHEYWASTTTEFICMSTCI